MNNSVLPPTSAQLEEARRVIADHLQPTPTATISINGRSVYAKLETLQITGSFKIRGALAAVDAALRAEPDGRVITSSAGNHGLGVAHAAMILGAHATVVVPANASIAKVAKLRQYDIELIQVGTSFDEAQEHAIKLAAERDIHYISPFNDTHVIAGQATVLDEMLTQAPDIEHLVVPIGGGGLISGALLTADHRGRSDLRITGVQPINSAAMFHVLRGATMAEVVHDVTIADGLAGGGDDGAATNAIIAQHHTPIVLVPESDIRAAVRHGAEANGLIFEGSASTAYAAIDLDLINDPHSRVGFFATGRNIASELLREILSEG
jgi:threonine dehydratase